MEMQQDNPYNTTLLYTMFPIFVMKDNNILPLVNI